MLGSARSSLDVLKICLILGIYGSVHFYLYKTFQRSPVYLLRFLARYHFIALSLAALPIIATLQLMHWGGDVPTYPAWMIAWGCCTGWLALGLLMLDGAEKLFKKLSKAAALPFTAPRRAWLRALSEQITLGSTVYMAYSSYRNARQPAHVVYQKIELAGWPTALSGFRIAQISDLHITPLLGHAHILQAIADTQALSADIIVLTGDLIDGPSRALRDLSAPLKDLQAKHGVFLVTGNHEYYFDAERWCQRFTELGIRVLRNESVVIEKQGGRFNLWGVDDLSGKFYGKGHGIDIKKAYNQAIAGLPNVLLAHQPAVVYQIKDYPIDLILSGHTHGGQIFPFGEIIYLQQPYKKGLHQYKQAQIYINSGTGFGGPPMRLGSTAEITCLEIYPKV
jgi:predicted MPP superfamily phosphohydrolase